MTDHSRLAAKFGRGASIADGEFPPYHPLACHMADVAAVALAMWDLVLPASSRTALSRGLGIPEGQARVWVGFLAGAHDFGKATRQFQAKDTAGHSARLAGSGLDARTSRPDPGHGRVTAALLPDYLESELHVERRLAATLAVVTGGHHGIFPVVDREGSLVSLDEEDAMTHAAWAAARLELFTTLRRLLGVEGTPAGPMPPAASMLLAGLISVSDWIGSIAEPWAFAWDPNGASDLAAYFAKARGVAHQVLQRERWLPHAPPSTPATFEHLFGRSPRPLQEAAVAVAPAVAAGGLVIIEAPMGEGKTEAALYLVDRWNSTGMGGMYLGLPTQATANQMHGRVTEFLAKRFPIEGANLVLAHGGARLFEEYATTPANVHDEDDDRGAIAAGEWFVRSSKRVLLAQWGVGTIDQSLMSVLQVKHVFVRLFGLAGKPVVIDEVHAYDTYMTGLLERLLEWLAALGSPVVLLSATLPRSRRQRLIDAYRRGAGLAPEVPEAAEYPRTMWTSHAGSGTEHFEANRDAARTLAVNRMEDSDEAVVDLLKRELASGGCAAVVCNTVGRAQQLYLLLRKDGAFAGNELGLFHSRFLAKDRKSIEDQCVRQFGPPRNGAETTESRPPRYVLVATQVIEQSLDVDFDVMVTDLAPADLLLQRSGRLQRHRRRDRKGSAVPTLHIRWPDEEDGPPQFDAGGKAIYDEHILLRTWDALRGRDSLAIPGEVQGLVDLVYADGEALPEAMDGRLAEMWRETFTEMRGKHLKMSALAQQPLIPDPSFIAEEFFEVFQPVPLLEDRPEAPPHRRARTRHEELPGIQVVWLTPDQAPLAQGDHTPDARSIHQLLLHSVSLSGHWTQSLARESASPPSWSESAALRHHVLVVPDAAGNFEVPNGPRISLDSELGIVLSFPPKTKGYDSD